MKTAIIKSDIWKDDNFYELSTDGKLLYMCLYTSPDRGLTEYMKYSTRMLSVYTGLNEKQVNVTLKELQNKGFISLVKEWIIFNHPNYIDIAKGKNTANGVNLELESIPDFIKNSTGKLQVNNLSATGHDNDNDNDNDNDTVIKKRKVKSETNAYSDQYEAFWLEYPEKKAKSKAYETWQKLKGINYAILINAIKLQNEAKHFRGKDGVDYIPHPATWLNQKRWEDEIKQKQINKVIII